MFASRGYGYFPKFIQATLLEMKQL